MSDSLWEALDDTLIAAVEAQLGAAGSYPDLHVVAVAVDDTYDTDKADNLPGVLITSNRSEIAPEGHGAGDPHVSVRYQYVIAAFAVGTGHRDARIAAQTLHARLIVLLRGWRAIIRDAQAATTSAEQAHQLRIRGSFVEVRARRDGARNKHIGAAYVRFDIETTN